MLSIRTLSRAVPRTSSRLFQGSNARTIASLSKRSQQRAWNMAWAPRRAMFSTGYTRYQEADGAVDQELSAKLESERQLELDASNPEVMPGPLKEYLEQNSHWELHDTPGEEEVSLTRTFGKEKIKVTFTVADLNFDAESDPESDPYTPDDPALYDEDSSPRQQRGAQSKSATTHGRTKGGNLNVAPDDPAPPASRAELADDETPAADPGEPAPGTSFAARLHIVIDKPGVAGALHVEATVRDGDVVTESLHYFAQSELAEARTAEADWQRRALYTGPPFNNLDEELQVLVDRFVQERGVDTGLALWVVDYVDWKEQREYVRWLDETKKFIDA